MNIISNMLEKKPHTKPLLTSTCYIELLHFNSDMHLLPPPTPLSHTHTCCRDTHIGGGHVKKSLHTRERSIKIFFSQLHIYINKYSLIYDKNKRQQKSFTYTLAHIL